MEVDVQLASAAESPAAARLEAWARQALAGRRAAAQLTVRVVDEAEMTALNGTYRHKAGPTNVLSFAAEPIPGVADDLLGDVVICAPVVAREAGEQGKEPAAHWAHMVVHGVLHLLGHDHVAAADAAEMEAEEVRILGELGYKDPYE